MRLIEILPARELNRYASRGERDMYIEESKEEMDRLFELCADNDDKIAFLAKYIRKIVFAADSEAEYKREQIERKA